MSTSTQGHTSVRSMFQGLIDYAGLFPPASLAMEPAVDEYLVARSGTHAWMLGRFIVPASRLDELVTVLRRKDPGVPVAVCAIVDSASDPRRWFGTAQERLAAIALLRSTVPQLAIEGLETKLPTLATQRDSYDAPIGQFAALASQAGLRDLAIFVELPRDTRWLAALPLAMEALIRARLGAKLRCGGAEPHAIPSVGDVAIFIAHAIRDEVPFKATAGLHHPVRHHRVQGGVVMHGFLNLLAATAFARDLDASMLEQIVAEEDSGAFRVDGDGFAWRDLRIESAAIPAMRRSFVAYGSCSFREPIDGLTALRLLPESA
ncbi:MAG: hypothetical protein ACYDGM_01960 [Vulcanimicrobiaceae bacterium]